MAKQFSELSPEHIEFMRAQHLYFVGTAGAEGYVNVSPKGMDSFRIVGSREVVWLNLTGSGNETATHVLESRRMTVMFCSFDKQPLILRLYGEAEVIHPRDPEWQRYFALFQNLAGARQVFRLHLSLVQTSCGFAVPHYRYQGERLTLQKWAEGQGSEGIARYWAEKNTESLDGKATGILDAVPQ